MELLEDMHEVENQEDPGHPEARHRHEGEPVGMGIIAGHRRADVTDHVEQHDSTLKHAWDVPRIEVTGIEPNVGGDPGGSGGGGRGVLGEPGVYHLALHLALVVGDFAGL